jgi:hypothetical protein
VGAAALVLNCFAGLRGLTMRGLTMLVVGCLVVAVMSAAGNGFWPITAHGGG